MNLLANMPLIAAGDVWEMIIGALFFILWTVGQLIGNRNEAKQKKEVRRPRPPQPVDGPPVEAQGPPKQEDALRNEVEEFLRRAQGKPPREQEQAPKKEPTLREQPRTPLREEPPQRRPRPEKKAQPRPQPVATRPKPTTVGSDIRRETDMRREGVAEHVAKHINTQTIAAHTEALGDEVEQADEKLESHLQEKFDHQVGNLAHEEKQERTSQEVNVAADIAAMLSRPEGMRQLIVANEILKRPEW